MYFCCGDNDFGVAIADFSGEGQVQAKRSRYLLKVNKRRCVITAYKRERGRWIPNEPVERPYSCLS